MARLSAVTQAAAQPCQHMAWVQVGTRAGHWRLACRYAAPHGLPVLSGPCLSCLAELSRLSHGQCLILVGSLAGPAHEAEPCQPLTHCCQLQVDKEGVRGERETQQEVLTSESSRAPGAISASRMLPARVVC